MLTIAKLGVGQEDYYLSKVARGLEDYYSGDGEIPGRWLGKGARRLGLGGEVSGAHLRAALEGLHPHTGERLSGRPGARRVPAWDLTFCAPKSVSVLHALGDASVLEKVSEAHDKAVTAGLAYLERHAVVSRRRVNGHVTPVRGEGLVVAAFRHRTSRAGDPHLHTHALATNIVERIDGGWGALHSPIVYQHARTAGFIYQALLRSELTDTLGVGWTNVHNGYAEIEGIDRRLLDLFSKRHSTIGSELARAGESSPRAADIAQRRTKSIKVVEADQLTLRQRWADEAQSLGLPDASALATTGTPSPTAHHLDTIAQQMRSPRGLTAHESTFEERDVVRAWCAALPAGTKVTLDDIEQLTQRFLTHPDIVPTADDRTRLRGHEVLYDADGTVTTPSHLRRRWTTTEMLETEERLLATAVTTRDAGRGQVPAPVAEQVLGARPDLSIEQAKFTREADAQWFLVETAPARERGSRIDPRQAEQPLADWAQEFMVLCRRLSPTTGHLPP